MRSACEQVLKIGAEKDERINLLQAEIVRMQEERMTDDAKDLAGNLRKEISDLQAKYQQACENAPELRSRLESIQGIHESDSFECKSVEEMKQSRAECAGDSPRNVQRTK
jgi:predicted RNase H-like nuclease (RuvC/YqgF family)